MFQTRTNSDSTDATASPDLGAAEAFTGGPRRAARSRADVLRTRVAPTVVSVALLATSGAFALNLKASESATTAVPAPVREDDAASRDFARELAELPAEEATAEDTEPAVGADAFVAGDWASAFGISAGDKYTQTRVVVRSQASGKSGELGGLKEGAKVSVTDKVTNGFRQIVHDGKLGWVPEGKLGDKAPVKPEPKPAAAKAVSSSGSSSGGSESYSGSTSYSGKSVLGLKPRAMVVYNAVTAKWSFNSIGGYRASNNRSNHGQGGAIDFMLTPGKESAKGWAVANYVAANAGAFNVDHIIFEQKIWTPYNPYWRAMENRGSVTANHYDHVHVSVKL